MTRVFAGMIRGPRPTQEDALTVGKSVFQKDGLPFQPVQDSAAHALFAVSDGMGGEPNGDWVSRAACTYLAELKDPPDSADGFIDVLAGLQAYLCEYAPHPRCGATLTGVLLRHDHALVFNAGDSRVYHQPAGETLAALTWDHSYVMQLVAAGELTPAAAQDHPLRHIVRFGIGPAFSDTWEHGTEQPQVLERPLARGDRLLITSDGFHEAVGLGQLNDELARFDPHAPNRFFDRIAAHSRDNASAILVQI